MLEELQITRDSVQVENRYKTCLKRKKNAVEHNARSGNSRTEVPFEEELSKIAANDNSIEPEGFVQRQKNKDYERLPKKGTSAKAIKQSGVHEKPT